MSRLKRGLSKLAGTIVLSVCALWILAPFMLMLVTSFRFMKDLTKNGPLSLPSEITLENYRKAWTQGNFIRYYKSSIIITVATVVLVLVLVLLASYAIQYMELPLKSMIVSLFLFGLIVPFEQIMLPLFANLRSYGWINRYIAVILPQTALNLPVGIMLVTTFMKKLPLTLIEAARIDGAAEISILFRVVTPLVSPILSTLLVFIAMGSWNNFMLPNIMLQSNAVKTLTVGLNAFKDSNSADFPLIAAAAFISAVPIMIIYIIFQKQIQESMTAGSVKE